MSSQLQNSSQFTEKYFAPGTVHSANEQLITKHPSQLTESTVLLLMWAMLYNKLIIMCKIWTFELLR